VIYADENVWQPVVEGLRRRGWEVTTARDEGTLGDSDREHLERAAEREWVVLTFDDDFLRLVNDGANDIDHAGVVYIAQDRHDVGELVRRINAALDRTENSDLRGRVVYA
jgi:hypothetical protein